MNSDRTKRDWRKLLAGGFAGMNAAFAVHPNDAERARKMVYTALREKVTLDEIKQAAREHLTHFGASADQIQDQVKRVEKFVKSVNPATRKKSAWLITWEHAEPNPPCIMDRLIAIRDGRTSPERVKEFVEQYYISTQYTPAEKMHYASHPKDNPYPANFGTHPLGGYWLSKVDCGHNPFIIALYVKNLRLYDDGMGDTALTWDELPPPKKRLSGD